MFTTSVNLQLVPASVRGQAFLIKKREENQEVETLIMVTPILVRGG